MKRKSAIRKGGAFLLRALSFHVISDHINLWLAHRIVVTEIDQQRVVWPPEPGFFTMRLVKGGPLVPARIVYEAIRDPITGQLLDRSWVWSAFINGVLVGEPNRNPSLALGVAKIWTFGTKISAEQYQAMILRKDAVLRSGSNLPESSPRKKIDLSKMKPVI